MQLISRRFTNFNHTLRNKGRCASVCPKSLKLLQESSNGQLHRPELWRTAAFEKEVLGLALSAHVPLSGKKHAEFRAHFCAFVQGCFDLELFFAAFRCAPVVYMRLQRNLGPSFCHAGFTLLMPWAWRSGRSTAS